MLFCISGLSQTPTDMSQSGLVLNLFQSIRMSKVKPFCPLACQLTGLGVYVNDLPAVF